MKNIIDWEQKINLYTNLLTNISFTDSSGREIGELRGFAFLIQLSNELKRKKKTLYAIGNGASASMASHFSADLAKNGKIHTQVFSDLSLITAISNDLGYEEVFSEPLKRRGQKGDILVAISSSGNSENILNAVKIAKKLGLEIITLSSMSVKNTLRKSGDLNIYIPAKTYGDAETCHAAVLHYWIDLVIK